MKTPLLIPLLAATLTAVAAERFKAPSDNTEITSLDKDRSAQLVEWKHPEYPAELKAEGDKAVVRMRFVVDEQGAVVTPEAIAGDERFYAAAIAAVQGWKFQPEMRGGQPLTTSQEVRMVFDPAGPPKGISKFGPPYGIEPSPLSPPVELNAPDPVYPTHLESRQLAGSVEMRLGVDEKGRVDGVAIGQVSHPEFLSAALAAVAGWEFRPAHFGRVNARGEKISVLQFSVHDPATGAELKEGWLERNGIFLREPAGTKTQDYFEVSPVAHVMVDPVYPYELLKTGVKGGARVDFTVNLEGEVIDIAVAEATAPEFGAATAAAIAAWQFKPLQRHGEATSANFSFTWKFGELREGGAEQRLLAGLAKGEQLVKPRQLDRPLFPLFLRQVAYPAEYLDRQEAGEADIEVIIDREGRVRLPRIVAATKPAFGWAAATAVSQWLFETPRLAGQPVDVRAIIPVEFKPK